MSEPNKYYVVILNKYPEYAQAFIDSIRATHKELPNIIVIRDGHEDTFGEGVSVCNSRQPFVYARNANIGIGFNKDCDVILSNDDLQCRETEFFNRLAKLANLDPSIGILSPLIDGGVGNPLQKYPAWWEILKYAKDQPVFEVGSTVCFPCVYIKRELINKIGLLDESFIGYGFDDDDFCIRTKLEGMKTCITPQLFIQHGIGGEGLQRGLNWSTSFAKESVSRETNLGIFLKKYPHLANKYR
jgi:GT2 family glycosyltransferase